jgi:DNA (cytosine-5)-methyltransferase 1
VRLWPTPQTDSFRSRGGTRRDEPGLDRLARRSFAAEVAGAAGQRVADCRNANPHLPSPLWMTPTARDWKDGASLTERVPVNGLLGRQVQRTIPAGGTTCGERRTLNPLFVEALMGWPVGWTGFAFAGTEWSRWWRLMRCELWRLSLPPKNDGRRRTHRPAAA